MEIEDLLALDSKTIKRLLNLMKGRQAAQSYEHKCSAQRICSTCRVKLCYACYNRHLEEAHGLQVAHFNAKLDNGSIFLPEQKEPPKTTTKKLRKVKRKLVSSEKPYYTLEEIRAKLEAGVLSLQEAILIYKELTK